MHHPAGEVLGTRPLEPSVFIDTDQYIDWVRHVVETGEEITDEVQFRNAAGRVRCGHMQIVPEHAPEARS